MNFPFFFFFFFFSQEKAAIRFPSPSRGLGIFKKSRVQSPTGWFWEIGLNPFALRGFPRGGFFPEQSEIFPPPPTPPP
ncbi:hypothetical protein, partial [Salmonella enterica]|uniref:hypothetical protein n=1 Tax=Salmonella enterica TaxID=28901 RepID=UPI0019553F18